MNTLNKKALFSFLILSLIFTAVFVSAAVLVNPLGSTNTIPKLLGKIAEGITKLVAALSVIFIVWAGILYLTSAGNPEQVKKGQTAFKYAIIGIVIALSVTVIKEVIFEILDYTPPSG